MFCITSHYFVAGVVLVDGYVERVAPILARYIHRHMNEEDVYMVCRKKGWDCERIAP